MAVMVPPRLNGVAGCRLKGIMLNWGDIKERGCVDPDKQWNVVCKHFDYHGCKRDRRCYAAPVETCRCGERELKTGS